MISKKEAFQKLTKLIEEKDAIDPIGKFLEYMKDNYNQLDEETKNWIDNAIEKMLNSAQKKIEKKIEDMDDSIERRNLARELSKLKGEHFESKKLIKILENEVQDETEILEIIRVIFEKRLQNYLDFLFDASKNIHKGPEIAALVGILYLCVDEFLTSFHLSQHFFINQTYTHIRSIWENLDKVELFSIKPEYLELWFSEDPKDTKKILYEFSPASVREKLGKQRYDPIYGFFSELGIHGTFKTIQSRSAIKITNSDLDKKTIAFWVGGVPFEHNIIFVNTFLIITLFMALLKVFKLFLDIINAKEAESIMLEAACELTDYFSKYVCEWAKNNNLDITAIVDWLNEVQKNLEKFKIET